MTYLISVFLFTQNLKRSHRNSIDVYTNAVYILRIDCWEAEKDLKTTPGSDCALNALAIDEPLEYVRLYLDGNLQMWVDAEDSTTKPLTNQFQDKLSFP